MTRIASMIRIRIPQADLSPYGHSLSLCGAHLHKALFYDTNKRSGVPTGWARLTAIIVTRLMVS